MSTLTIRNIPNDLLRIYKLKARLNGRSVEDEVWSAIERFMETNEPNPPNATGRADKPAKLGKRRKT